MKNTSALVITVYLFSMALSASAQNAEPANANTTAIAKIHFAYDHDALETPHYEFDVYADGHASYKSSGKADTQTGEVETLSKEFKVSPATRSRIFELAKAADYFNGSFEYTKNKVAFSGKKTLSYADPTRNGSTSFNWTENKAVTELSGIFQGMSATLEAEPRLRRLRRFDKLGLNAELAKLEQMAASGWLTEIDLIGDILREISQDGTIMGMARHRADHLLQIAAAQR
jgi:hypothetical protein